MQVYALLFVGLTGALNTYAQDEEAYSFHFENQTLGQILKEISKETGYKFAYSKSEVETGNRASFSISGQAISGIVEIVSAEFNLHWEFVGKTIILNTHSIREAHLVRGTVLDSEKLQPMQWVNISTQDNLQGTLTDSAGNFQINMTSGQEQLRFSFVGFKTQTIYIRHDTTVRILLEGDIQEFEEIVVVAFGQENRDLITGSVAVHDPGVFSQLNNESVNSSLQSTLPGVLVKNNAGTPGSAMSVTIRGISSITAGNSPLYIVDGIPMIRGNYSQLDFSGQTIDAVTDLSIYDIASISVLKDAAASSLYGASSSNGVILINTKKGREKGNQIQIESYYGLQQSTGQALHAQCPAVENPCE